MSIETSEAFEGQQPSGYEHGPRRGRRIPRSEVDEVYLRSLQATNSVRSVGDDFDPAKTQFPPTVTHIMYPNGDLERVGYR